MKVLDRVRDKLTEHFGHGGVLQTDRPDHHGKLPGSFQNPWPSADDHTHPVDFPFSREKEVHHGMKGAALNLQVVASANMMYFDRNQCTKTRL